MPQDPPDAATLLEAVRDWLGQTLLPEASGGRAFHLRVAMNTLHIVQRELEQGAALQAAERERLIALLGREGSVEELNHALCEAIRAGEMVERREELLAHLRLTTDGKLQVANPRYR